MEREGECNFGKEFYPGIKVVIKVVMAQDLNSLNDNEDEKITVSPGPFLNYYPAIWYQSFDGGTVWITTLGYDKKS